MGALRQKQASEQLPKNSAVGKVKADRFGRDPESLPEKLRDQTGYAPFFHAWNADLPRLLGPSAVARDLINQINRLSLGRSREAKQPRFTWTSPVSVQELSEYCRCDVRDIQRQMKELSERGVISSKCVKNGSVKYVLSLCVSEWQGIEDYAVWKRRQIVAIDEAETQDETEDDDLVEISTDAVQLFKRPASVRPGCASRAAKVAVGIREIVVQNESSTVDATFTAVVQSGRLVVSASFAVGENIAKGENKANGRRHPCRGVPTNEGIEIPPHAWKNNPGGETPNPRSTEIISLFDPLLQKSGSRLLSPDIAALRAACAELGAMPRESLVYFVLGPKGRGARPISGPRAVISIVREARHNWESGERERAKAPAAVRCKCGGDILDVQAGLCAKCLDADQT